MTAPPQRGVAGTWPRPGAAPHRQAAGDDRTETTGLAWTGDVADAVRYAAATGDANTAVAVLGHRANDAARRGDHATVVACNTAIVRALHTTRRCAAAHARIGPALRACTPITDPVITATTVYQCSAVLITCGHHTEAGRLLHRHTRTPAVRARRDAGWPRLHTILTDIRRSHPQCRRPGHALINPHTARPDHHWDELLTTTAAGPAACGFADIQPIRERL